MKTEEIRLGDILYDEERKMLVKKARVDEDGVVKYSAYTDMQRIFKTVPPPYRVGTRTADASIPATDEQCKYMKRELAVCEYVNLPKDNRMEALANIIADLKTENVELEQRVHQLVDDYNDVARQLRGMEKRKGVDHAKQTSRDMIKMRDHCDILEKDNEQLKRQCVQLHTERNEATKHADECELQKKELFKHIARFEKSEFLKIGDACTHRTFSPGGNPVKIGSGICNSCRHLIKVDVSGRKCVLCAWCYDNTKAEEAQESKTTDD